jgi:hypothetical protein
VQTVLERLPAILQASAGIFGAVAAPLGNIDKMVVIDQGGNGDGQGSGAARLARTGPTVVFQLLQQMEALGLDVPSMLQQLGVGDQAAKGEKSVRPAVAEPATSAVAPPVGPLAGEPVKPVRA